MKTIKDIIDLMYEKGEIGCPEVICQYCKKYNFCWFDSLRIARVYIEKGDY